MENIKDWCISRQIWWGHQIPAWYCARCDAANILKAGSGNNLLGKDAQPIVARDKPAYCPRCGGAELIQDPDVLDTWFSSGLWPFSTLGWPEATDDLKTFYPTSALVTGFDILFFWVARMIMMGLKFMDDVPFRDVYIHALVRDEQGQKMSKSKGNVIDPLDVMSEYGTDAFRFTLAAMAAMGRDIKLAQDRIAGYQNFVNKLWNAARFVLMHVPRGAAEFAGEAPALNAENLSFAERWIRSRLAVTIREARAAVEAYRFNDFANTLYQFTWHEFCDWYIEMIKPALNAGGADSVRSRQFLVELLQQILLLLHPIMPFVTEEIWQALDGKSKTIMLETYPRGADSWSDPAAESEMGFLMDAVRAVRNLRTELNCPPGKEVKVLFYGQERDLASLQRHQLFLRLLARVGTAEYFQNGDRPKGAAAAMAGTTEIYLPLDDAINLDEEHRRLRKEAGKVSEELARVQKKLGNGDFLSKAKAEVVQKERDKAQQYEDKLRALNSSLARIEELRAGRQ
jgi:valyl-tRNA synthetase